MANKASRKECGLMVVASVVHISLKRLESWSLIEKSLLDQFTKTNNLIYQFIQNVDESELILDPMSSIIRKIVKKMSKQYDLTIKQKGKRKTKYTLIGPILYLLNLY